MKKRNIDTKEGMKYYNAWLRATATELHEVYKTWSNRKYSAYLWCYNEFHKDENAKGFRIISHNSEHFTVAWITKDESGDFALRVETYCNSYLFVSVAK